MRVDHNTKTLTLTQTLDHLRVCYSDHWATTPATKKFCFFLKGEFGKDYTTHHNETALTVFGVLFNGVTGIMGMNECLHILGFQSVLKQAASAGRLGGCYKFQAPRPPY